MTSVEYFEKQLHKAEANLVKARTDDEREGLMNKISYFIDAICALKAFERNGDSDVQKTF